MQRSKKEPVAGVAKATTSFIFHDEEGEAWGSAVEADGFPTPTDFTDHGKMTTTRDFFFGAEDEFAEQVDSALPV